MKLDPFSQHATQQEYSQHGQKLWEHHSRHQYNMNIIYLHSYWNDVSTLLYGHKVQTPVTRPRQVSCTLPSLPLSMQIHSHRSTHTHHIYHIFSLFRVSTRHPSSPSSSHKLHHSSPRKCYLTHPHYPMLTNTGTINLHAAGEVYMPHSTHVQELVCKKDYRMRQPHRLFISGMRSLARHAVFPAR